MGVREEGFEGLVEVRKWGSRRWRVRRRFGRESTSCSVQNRPHSPECTLFSPFHGLTIGANHSVQPAYMGRYGSLRSMAATREPAQRRWLGRLSLCRRHALFLSIFPYTTLPRTRQCAAASAWRYHIFPISWSNDWGQPYHFTEILMKTFAQKVSRIRTLTDKITWDAYDRATEMNARKDIGYLEFSRRRDGDLRVSEQEARFAFVESLCQEGLGYSIEVPTMKRYRFEGESGNTQSAQTDLQIRDRRSNEICNVEFKSKGITLGASWDTKKPIYKDVEKLMREPTWGLWFHLLKGVNRSTIPNLLCVIAEQIAKVREAHMDLEAPGLTIHICVLREKFSLCKDVPLSLTDADIAKHLFVEYRVSNGKLTNRRILNGWCLNEGAL